VTAKDQARSGIAAAADQLLELSHRIRREPRLERLRASTNQN